MQKENTLILFGRSWFINEIRPSINPLIAKYHSMGVNSFCESFKDVEYVIWTDDYPPNFEEHHTVITNLWWWQNKRSRTFEKIKNHDKKELYIFENEDRYFSDSSLKLNLCFHTPSVALNWAYLKGFKTVILAGIDLNINDLRHFDDEGFNPCWLPDGVNKARWHLENVATKYLKIYQLNPKSDLQLEKIDIKELLKC